MLRVAWEGPECSSTRCTLPKTLGTDAALCLVTVARACVRFPYNHQGFLTQNSSLASVGVQSSAGWTAEKIMYDFRK